MYCDKEVPIHDTIQYAKMQERAPGLCCGSQCTEFQYTEYTVGHQIMLLVYPLHGFVGLQWLHTLHFMIFGPKHKAFKCNDTPSHDSIHCTLYCWTLYLDISKNWLIFSPLIA